MMARARAGKAFTQYAITFRFGPPIAAGMLRTKMLPAGYFDDESLLDLIGLRKFGVVSC
jgi:hypothetical protein